MKKLRIVMMLTLLISVLTLATGLSPAYATQTWVMIHHEAQGNHDETWDKCMPLSAWNGHDDHEGDYKGAECTPPGDDDDDDDDDTDVCLNLDGLQTEVPEGYTSDGQGNCTPVGDDDDDDVVDLCLNLDGIQEEVPEGYTQDGYYCYPVGDDDDDGDDDTTDVCPNIQGEQAEVPKGYHKNDRGNCVRDGGDDGGQEVCDPATGASTIVSSNDAGNYPKPIKTGPNPEDPFVCWATLCDPETNTVFDVFGYDAWLKAHEKPGVTGDLTQCTVEVPENPDTGGVDPISLLQVVIGGLGTLGSSLVLGGSLFLKKRTTA